MVHSCWLWLYPSASQGTLFVSAGNTVLLSLLECGSYVVAPLVASVTMAMQLGYDANLKGTPITELILVTVTLVSVPFIIALAFGSMCMVDAVKSCVFAAWLH
jgi:hypothetical protein